MKRALDNKNDILKRADAVRELNASSGAFIAVFTGDDRDWPSVHQEDGTFSEKGFFSGGFEGWLVIVGTVTASPICAAPSLSRTRPP